MTTRPAPQPGIAAQWPGWCSRCDQVVCVGDRVIFRRGEYVHCACVNGGEDG